MEPGSLALAASIYDVLVLLEVALNILQRCLLPVFFGLFSLVCAAAQGETSRETIVMVRHGEKPEAGLGQLDCRGLNRALALPKVLLAAYGRPDLIVAANPAQRKDDGGIDYDYIRPLATIEPTAVALGLPVNVQIGFHDDQGLESLLLDPAQAGHTIFVAWEHHLLVKVAKDMLTRLGANPAQVPEWSATDFDSIYRIDILRAGHTVTARFYHEAEQLTPQSADCPGMAGH